MAPEVVTRERPYDGRAADIWSAGCVLFVLLAGGMPFDEPDDAALAGTTLFLFACPFSIWHASNH
jgi:serine/threonine protein kinase